MTARERPVPKRDTAAVVRARCVGCGQERDIAPGEVFNGDQPMCHACYSPMVAVSARHAERKAKGRKRG